MEIFENPTLIAHIRQAKCWQIYPPVECQFHRFLLWQVLFYFYSESSYWADQVLADLPPPSNSNFTDSFSDRSYFIPTVRGHIGQTRCRQIYPLPKWQFLIFLLWQVILDRPSVGRSTAHRMAVSQIPSLTGHILFLLKEVILGRPGLGISTPSIKQQFHRFLLWQVIFHSYHERSYWADQVWQICHLVEGNFTDSCSDGSYFILTVRAHIG